jgi:hypothetical protein
MCLFIQVTFLCVHVSLWNLDGWRVVDDDDYKQSVGNPKRKV